MKYYLVLLFILVQLSVLVSSVSGTKCGEDENLLTLHIRVQFYEQSILEASKYSKSIKSSKSFKKSLSDVKAAAEVSASYKSIFSASASGSYSRLTEDVSDTESYSETIESANTTFKPNFLQIVRETTTTLSINGDSASTSELKFVDSIRQENSIGEKELRQRAVDYMKFNYGDGVVRNSYTESVCKKRVEISPLSQNAKLELMEGIGGFKKSVCQIDWLNNDRFLNFKKNNCWNDKAKSAFLTGAISGTRITIFDDAEGKRNDDYTIIKVKGNMGRHEKVLIMNLEQSETMKLDDGGVVEVIYKRKNGLNGKVSSVDIELW